MVASPAGCHLLVPYKEKAPDAAPDLGADSRLDGVGPRDTGADVKPDKAKPDLVRPDKGKPDLPKPDLPKPDKGKPDLPMLDKGKPDAAKPATVYTHAGSPGVPGKGNGGAFGATFKLPRGVELGYSGELYVADSGNHMIRKVYAGSVTTVAGTGSAGSKTGAFGAAEFNKPRGMSTNPWVKRLIVADYSGHRIRTLDLTKGTVGHVAGNGAAGFLDHGSDPHKSSFKNPADVVYSTTANGYYIADSLNHRVRLVQGTTTSTVGGGSTAGHKDGAAGSSQFNVPSGVAEHKGVLYVADKSNHVIRTISGGQVKTFAGTKMVKGNTDGAVGKAQFYFPCDVEVDAAGTVYVADTYNNRIRVIKGGKVSTLAGSTKGFKNGSAKVAQFDHPRGIAVDKSGTVYVADTGNHVIRKIVP